MRRAAMAPASSLSSAATSVQVGWFEHYQSLIASDFLFQLFVSVPPLPRTLPLSPHVSSVPLYKQLLPTLFLSNRLLVPWQEQELHQHWLLCHQHQKNNSSHLIKSTHLLPPNMSSSILLHDLLYLALLRDLTAPFLHTDRPVAAKHSP